LAQFLIRLSVYSVFLFDFSLIYLILSRRKTLSQSVAFIFFYKPVSFTNIAVRRQTLCLEVFVRFAGFVKFEIFYITTARIV
jgi:hypothetical protein